jgi:hypothetical protein
MKPGSLRLIIAFFALLLLLPDYAFATHLRAGEITVRRDACNSLKFWITITVFTNTKDTQVLFGGDDDILDFGDGSDPDHDGRPGMLVPETQNTPRPDLGDGIATASFTIDHIYAAGFRYTISYSEPNRNEGVVNMDGSVNTRFYIETQIIIDALLGCNENTPVLAVPPIDRGCTGVAWFHNPGAYDLDGDSLSYQMVIPFRERGTQVVNYKSPIDPKFYPNGYENASENEERPTFDINPVDGTITWDAPGSAGEYNIAFVIKEWRNVKGKWIQIGFVRRDMQIIIEDCENNRPDLIVPEDVCVEAGTTLDATIFGIDQDGDNVKIEAFSEIFFLANAQSPATYSPNPAKFQPSTPPAELTFQWKTECAHVKDQPYQVVFKVTDSAKGPDLVTFKTWLIRVVGPKPQFPEDDNEAISLNIVDRTATLNWDKYFCQNAQSIQIWRKVDSLAFEPDTCQTGMPENLGYQLIDVVPASEFTYTDTNNGQGLTSGAVYCYRLVAIFPAPRGGESPVSKEVCLPPILADEPIITKVSVLETSTENGKVEVSWLPPFEVDTVQFPPPYQYRVLRGEGFSGTANLAVAAGPITTTTFVDAGLNTAAKIYNYRVLATSSSGSPLDTSGVASTVRLGAESELNKIGLQWEASVPWSNEVPGLKHRIYRGDEGADTPDDLTLIDSVEVSGTGFFYTDEGQFNGVPLETGKFYCYLVETLGSYGSDEPILMAEEPLRNFSQIMCTQPGDTVPPCKPLAVKTVNAQDCNSVACRPDPIENVISWEAVLDECGEDIASYKVYFARDENGVYEFKAQVTETTYTHTNLTSYAGCYKVSAVDRSGNESELSDPVCIDNCTHYELPNVFTPNGDGCNELFSAFSDKDEDGEGEQTTGCEDEVDNSKCARFVEDVTFTVYNRWGKEVYYYTTVGTPEDKTIYIDWDGRGSNGKDLASGVYYYVADVVFTTVNPAKRFETKKGWIHLLR